MSILIFISEFDVIVQKTNHGFQLRSKSVYFWKVFEEYNPAWLLSVVLYKVKLPEIKNKIKSNLTNLIAKISEIT